MAKRISDTVRDLRRLNSQLLLLNEPGRFIERVNKTLAYEKHLTAVVTERFITEGASSRGSWDALAPSTVKTRLRQGFGGEHPILARSGTLFKAAVAKEIGTREGVFLVFKDGPAPVYTGGGRAKRPKGGKTLSQYAEALNKVRPFYGPLTRTEAAPILQRRRELIRQTLAAILKGESINGILRR